MGGAENRLGCAFKHHFASFAAPFGSHVDDPIGVADHIQVMLDHDHRVAGVDQPVHHRQQVTDVRHVQAGGRLVHHIDAALFMQLTCQFNALTFAAGKRTERLAQGEIIQPDIAQRL